MRRRLVPSLPLILVLASQPPLAGHDAPDPPPLGDDTPTLCQDPQSCIEQLASAFTQNVILTDMPDDHEIQVTTFAWSARSFSRSSDFYMINQYVRSSISPMVSTQDWQFFLDNKLVDPAIEPFISSIVPQNSTCDTQIVNDSTTSFSGSVGLTSLGPEVGVGESSSWSQQTWTSCSSLSIVQGAPPRAVYWDYVLQDATYSNEALVMTQQWVWEIPWTALADANSGISFTTEAAVITSEQYAIDQTFTVNVPAPFDSFTIPTPTLTSASPSMVKAGTVFTLSGTNLYPTGISGLFIAGNALDPTLWFPVQDGMNDKIIVITPDDLSPRQSYPIEVETPGGVATGVSIEVTR